MKKIFYFFLLAFVSIITACEEEDSLELGDLNVVVNHNFINGGYYGSGLEDCVIFTKPASKQGITDEYGSALLKGLEPGTYEIFATRQGYGSGKATARVKLDELSTVNIVLNPSVELNVAPTIDFILPAMPAEFEYGAEIVFSADVADKETASQNLKVQWESDLDGLLNNDSPNSQGNVRFSTTTLSKGIHSITLKVEDEEGYFSTHTFEVSTLSPPAPELKSALKRVGEVSLTWSRFDGDDFLQYEVFRQSSFDNEYNDELLAIIDNKEIVEYSDITVPIAQRASYYVRITTKSGYANNSNIEEVVNPNGKIFPFRPEQIFIHPSKSYVYLVNENPGKVLKVDFTTFEVESEKNLDGVLGFGELGENGQGYELYIPSSDGNVYVLNLESLEIETEIYTGKENSSVAINGLGHLIVGLDPDPDAWWEDPIRTFSRETGLLIDGDGDNERDIVKRIPNRNEFISISTGVSPVDMEFFKLNASGEIVTHEDDSYHGDHPLHSGVFKISNSGEYVVTSEEGAVYSANSSMEYLGNIGGYDLSYSDFAFSNDGSVIYAGTSNRKSIQLASYPDLIRNDEILTRGYPRLLVKRGTHMICFSTKSPTSYYYETYDDIGILEYIEVPE